ncbi:hypothetical protein [Spirillospora sp. NPDC029432]|uniref:hypothetical protein n=1 Tax=Spirillospora sp. NPDC029432 TaxID=3154599 RepID=UPI003453355B
MNRRGNGLSADTYAPLVDLAPHLADVMLTALGEAGVAAYAATPGELAGLAEEAAAARDVLDRLYVDVEMKPAAEDILRSHLSRLRDERRDLDLRDLDLRDADLHDAELRDAELRDLDARDPDRRDPDAGDPSPRDSEPPAAGGEAAGGTGPDVEKLDEDAIWAEIVAGFDAVPEGDRVPWPDQENIDEPEPRRPPREGDDRTGRLPRARVIKFGEDDEEAPAAGKEGEEDEEDEDGHYVPPPPPPLPAADPLTKGAWVALVGGPLYLLLTVILDWEVPGWAAFLAVAAFIGGFVTLVLRMGDEPRDGDDGAVV